jgi:hypothetical protein
MRSRRTRVAIYCSCALLLSVALVLEVWVVTRHSGGAQASIRSRMEQRPDRDVRPLPREARSPDASHIDPRLSHAATRLGRGRAEVRCWSTGEWAVIVRQLNQGDDVNAYTTIDRRRVHFPWRTCIWLRFAGMKAHPRVPRAEALAAFAHEVEHLRGIADEAQAECYSHQRLGVMAQALGASDDEARRLVQVAWREFYPPSDADYVSAECRNGGRLDLHPGRRQWP